MKNEIIKFLIGRNLLLSPDLDTRFNLNLTRDCHIHSTKELIQSIEDFTNIKLSEQKLNLPGIVRPAGERLEYIKGLEIKIRDCEDSLDMVSWDCQCGILISKRDAIKIVEMLKAAAQEGELLPAEGKAQGGSKAICGHEHQNVIWINGWAYDQCLLCGERWEQI